MPDRYTRLQIVRILRERGWTNERSLWFFPTAAYGNVVKHMGVSLRDAASFEALSSSENLDPRRKNAGN